MQYCRQFQFKTREERFTPKGVMFLQGTVRSHKKLYASTIPPWPKTGVCLLAMLQWLHISLNIKYMKKMHGMLDLRFSQRSLRCNAVQLGRCPPLLQRNILPPLSASQATHQQAETSTRLQAFTTQNTVLFKMHGKMEPRWEDSQRIFWSINPVLHKSHAIADVSKVWTRYLQNINWIHYQRTKPARTIKVEN